MNFKNVIVNPPPVLHHLHNGGEVIVEQNHSRRFFGHFGAIDAHGDADVGIFERRRVVHAVTGHGHKLVPSL